MPTPEKPVPDAVREHMRKLGAKGGRSKSAAKLAALALTRERTAAKRRAKHA